MSEVSVCFCAMPRAALAEELAEVMLDDSGEREAFDALRAPLGADFVAGNAPTFSV